VLKRKQISTIVLFFRKNVHKIFKLLCGTQRNLMFHVCCKWNCHPPFSSFFIMSSHSLPHQNTFRSCISKLPSSSFFPRHLNEAKVEVSGKDTTWETLRVERPQISQMCTKPQAAFMNCCNHGLRVRNTSNQGFIQVVLRFEVNVALLL